MKTSVISRGIPREVSRTQGRPGRLRGYRDRVRGAGGLPPPHQRPEAADRREQHPGHPQCRPRRLSRRRGGREHAAAGSAGEGRHPAAAVYRRRPPERHLGQPVDPERLAGSGRGRRAGIAGDGRQGPRRHRQAYRQHHDFTAEELAKRKAAWKPNLVQSQTPWQELQRKFVGQLASGACLDFAVNLSEDRPD